MGEWRYSSVARKKIYIFIHTTRPITVAELSKACTVFARSEAAIMGSNPTEGMDV
jgi:hypothetical protein